MKRRNEWVLTTTDDVAVVEAGVRAAGAAAVESEGLGLEDLFIEYTSGAAGEVRS
jgi:hypothetical protein